MSVSRWNLANVSRKGTKRYQTLANFTHSQRAQRMRPLREENFQQSFKIVVFNYEEQFKKPSLRFLHPTPAPGLQLQFPAGWNLHTFGWLAFLLAALLPGSRSKENLEFRTLKSTPVGTNHNNMTGDDKIQESADEQQVRRREMSGDVMIRCKLVKICHRSSVEMLTLWISVSKQRLFIMQRVNQRHREKLRSALCEQKHYLTSQSESAYQGKRVEAISCRWQWRNTSFHRSHIVPTFPPTLIQRFTEKQIQRS